MKVTLQAKKSGKSHSFNIVVRAKELVLTTPDGDEIASIAVETMEKDAIQPDGKYKTELSNNFFVTFHSADASSGHDAAYAWVEPMPEVK